MTKIGALVVGAKGAVATTLMAAQAAQDIGLGYEFRLPSEAEDAYRHLPLVGLGDIAFGGWDISSRSYSDSCRLHRVLEGQVVDRIASRLDGITSYPAIAVEPDSVMAAVLETEDGHQRMKDVDFSTTVFTKRPSRDLIQSLTYDIADFRERQDVTTVVVCDLASTERPVDLAACHATPEAFEAALDASDPGITTGMLYAYAAISNGCHFVNFTPSVTADIPALVALAERQQVALAGKDGKTGQTLYKTVLGPLFRARGLRVTGWYSANILGNRDGLALSDPRHRASKIETKSGVLDSILGYSDFDHQVHIHYYRPRGDAKEAWDNVDFTGWFDTPMQMKIDWLGDDSVLAAPLVLDLIRWVHFFTNRGESGVLSQLAAFFKCPQGCTEHDFFKQLDLLRRHVQQRYAT